MKTNGGMSRFVEKAESLTTEKGKGTLRERENSHLEKGMKLHMRATRAQDKARKALLKAKSLLKEFIDSLGNTVDNIMFRKRNRQRTKQRLQQSGNY